MKAPQPRTSTAGRPMADCRDSLRARIARAYPAQLRTVVAYALITGGVALVTTAGAMAQVRLAPGTVPVLKAVVSGATVGAPVTTPTGATLTVNQQSQGALIDWSQFNIANGSAVIFNQPSANAVALNRIFDLSPSIIQGKLSANGQVWLVNQNGIMFGQGAQVNVNTLVASTLNISDTLVTQGLSSGGTTYAAFSGSYDVNSGAPLSATPSGTIQIGNVGDGKLAPQINAANGGTIIMVSPVINNASGLISAPGGQVILAAGSSAYLSQADVSASPSVRGYVVQINADQGDVNLTSLIQNQGSIKSDRGNVTLAGLAVNQSGVVSATTSALYNGTVVLQSSSQTGQGGTVTLGPGSVTSSPIDTTDTTMLTAGQTFVGGTVSVTGKTIISQGTVSAPAGTISMVANDKVDPLGSRIYLDQGSKLDVSGDWASAPYSSSLATFKVTSNELANAPDQKGGLLEGSTVTVNLNQASTILDLTGYQQTRLETVAQKATSGGTVDLNSSGDLVTRLGSIVDVSGGGTHVLAGMNTTTELIAASGAVYSINAAPEGLSYVGLLGTYQVSHPRWGLTNTFTSTLGLGTLEAAYDNGASAGSVNVQVGAGLAFDGAVLGGVTVGANQLTNAPRGGNLTIGQSSTNIPDYGIKDVTFSATPADNLGGAFTAATALSTQQVEQTVLSSSLVSSASGLDSVRVNANGTISVPAGVTLSAPVGGTVAMTGSQIALAGTINAPAGMVTLAGETTVMSGTTPANANSPIPYGGVITMASGSSINAAGVWINSDGVNGAIVGPATPSSLSAGTAGSANANTLAGGGVTVTAGQVRLDGNSLIDVSGGGQIARSGAITGGAGGTITVGATTALINDPLLAIPVSVALNGRLRGESLANGGKLKVVAGDVSINGGVLPSGTNLQNALNLAPAFFTQGGFTSYDITGGSAVAIAPGTTIAPIAQSETVASALAAALPSGGNLESISQVVQLPAATRPATSLALRTSNPLSHQIAIENGTSITVDPGASITVAAVNGLAINGTLSAPGGTVSLSVSGPTVNGSDTDPVSLLLGPNAIISAAGTFVPSLANSTLQTGQLIAGGKISLSATNGFVQTYTGSILDVSGTSHAVDIYEGQGTNAYVLQTRGSNAGSVSVAATDGISLAGTMSGHAGTPQNGGGSFSLQLTNRNNSLDTAANGQIREVVVSSDGSASASTLQSSAVLAAFPLTALSSGGFDKLSLQSEDVIDFEGTTTVSFARGVTLDSPQFLLEAGANATLTGAEVALINSWGTRVPDPVSGTNGVNVPFNGTAAGAVATTTGDGVLNVRGSTVDLYGSLTVNGAASINLTSDNDVRFSGRRVLSADSESAQLIGSLTTDADVTITATQAYPTTRSNFSINVLPPTGTLTFLANGKTDSPVLSAGGLLSLNAATIDQGGNIRAPLGEIDLAAAQALILEPGSVTSVSAAGLLIPYGETEAGVQWLYGPTNFTPGTSNLTAPPVKKIILSSPSVVQKSGAVVDVSGGGDIFASEFVSGSGGTSDITLAANTYAIVPSANFAAAPFDPDILAKSNNGIGFSPTQNRSSAIYDSILIGSGGAVAAGSYVLLPAAYAFVPGAYLVQLQTGSAYQNLQSGAAASLSNGAPVIVGHLAVAGTSVEQAATVGVVLQPGSAISRYSDFTITKSSFFTDLANENGTTLAQKTGDAGQVQISAAMQLALDGTIATAPVSGGNAATVDISATKIALVDQTGNTAIDPSYLQISTRDLSDVDANLLIGGIRSDSGSGTRVQSSATSILVANTSAAPLSAPELLLTASHSIEISGTSVLNGTGSVTGLSKDIIADSTGSLIRLANSAQVTVDRGSAVNRSGGTILVDAGAVLNAGQSALLNATQSTQIAGVLNIAPGGALSLGAPTIAVGDFGATAPVGAGLALDTAATTRFSQLGQLTLQSGSNIDFYGTIALGSPAMKALTLDAAQLVGLTGVTNGNPAQTTLTATNLFYVNSASPSTGILGTGSGTLTANASQITIGVGDKALSGYSNVGLNAATAVNVQDAGSLFVAGNVTVSAQAVTASGGANQTITTLASGASTSPFDVNFVAITTPAGVPDTSGVGGRLQVVANSISDSIPVIAKSGSIALSASGSGANGGIAILSGGKLDASGTNKSFGGDIVTADGGSVQITSAAAAVSIAAGALVDVSADSHGGRAGQIAVTASGLTLNGTLNGSAASASQSGSVSLDLGSFAALSSINSGLNAGGFDRARTFRARTGDITIAATDDVIANQVTMSTDQGAINVLGTIDASSSGGSGSVSLFAQNGLTLAAGSLINARGTSTDGSASAVSSNGGQVDVQARSGVLTFDSAATIDIRSGAVGKAGTIVFSAPQTQDSTQTYDGVAVALNGTVLSASGTAGSGSVSVQGSRIYTNAAPSSSDINGYASDYANFVQSVPAGVVLAGLQSDSGSAVANANVTGSVEIQSPGDMVLNANWSLATGPWNAGAPSMLTLRAAGDLTVNSILGITSTTLSTMPGWSVRLAAGADLASANPLATQSLAALGGSGSVILPTATSKIVTSTGNIQVAAGTDVNLGAARAVIISTGDVAVADGTNGRWATNGGNISISAQRDILGTASTEWVSDWLRRATNGGRGAVLNGSWWVYRPDFQQSTGALGGGNVEIEAGRNIENFSAAIPTSGLVTGTGSNQQLTVFGGGNLGVFAGGDLDGGNFLVGLGQGVINAGGNIGASAPIQLFMLGQASGTQLRNESISVVAGGTLAVQSVVNPTATVLTASTGTGPSFQLGSQQATFFTYSDNASLALLSKRGDVTLGLAPAAVTGLSPSDTNLLTGLTATPSVLPSSVSVVALNGDITTAGPPEQAGVLYPSSTGSLKVLASGAIDNVFLAASDYASGEVPTWSNATQQSFSYLSGGNSLTAVTSTYLVANPNALTGTPRIVTRTVTGPYAFDVQALGGDIKGSAFNFPGTTRIYARDNIIGGASGGGATGNYTIENLNPTDVSVMQADTGNILLNSQDVIVGGPGQFLMQAGGTIDLGATVAGPKLQSVGSNDNPSLPTSTGARLTLVAGLSGAVDLSQLQPALDGVLAAGEETTGTPAEHSASAEAAMSGFYASGTVQSGNINSYLTSIQTVGNGDIDLIAPNGNITVGLTSPQGSNQIGVITNAGGKIQSFLSGDFTINTGKVVTARGGDIMIFTTGGNIDAGRGAKTSITAPAPQRECDAQGLCTYVLSAGVTGSGIQTVTTSPEPGEPAPPPAGSIFLFAPSGYVDAGEAGIKSGGNVFIAAQQVLNASNISSSGTSVGVPVVQSGSIASSLATSGTGSLPGADQAAAEAARAATQAATAGTGDAFGTSILTVDVVGFGAKDCKETDKQCLGLPK